MWSLWVFREKCDETALGADPGGEWSVLPTPINLGIAVKGPEALTNIGVMYGKGQGLPQSFVNAPVYFSLPAQRGNAQTASFIPELEAAMSPGDIAKAQELSKKWTPGK